MKKLRVPDRFPRSIVLVVGDFSRSAAEVFALRDLDARVVAAGLGTAVVRRQFAARGVDTSGLMRPRKAVLEAALDRSPLADAILFGAGDWARERAEVMDAERSLAFMDGRSVRPLLWRGDSRYRFLRSARQGARFTAARAAGADFEAAKEFATRQSRGHQSKDSQPGIRRRSRPAQPKARKPS